MRCAREFLTEHLKNFNKFELTNFTQHEQYHLAIYMNQKMSSRMSVSKVDEENKIKPRRESVSPSRRPKANGFRERSRDRSYDRSSIVSTGNQSRVQETSKKSSSSDDDSKNDLKSEDERGRTNNRKAQEIIAKEEAEGDQIDDHGEEQDMMLKLMGFGSFDSTKGKHVAGVGSGTAKKNKKAQFRQYMNRDKGFNRNLSPDRTKRK